MADNKFPGWAKGVIAVAVVAGGVFVVYKINKAVKDAKLNKGNKQEDKTINKALQQLSSNPATQPKMSQAQAEISANALHAAMDGYGTDALAISRIFSQLKNDADFLLLSSAYGIREISTGAFNPAPNFKGTMVASLVDELNPSQRNVLNDMLKKQGIIYKI